MRRAIATVIATVIGLVALLQFKTHPSGGTTHTLASLGAQPIASPVSPPAERRAKAEHPSRLGATRSKSTAPRPTTVTATGQLVQTRYGPVQVRVTEIAGRLTDVTAIHVPSGSPHSSEIAARAVPILRSEALRANNARIDVVSGATYTSDGYAQSLQSALDNA